MNATMDTTMNAAMDAAMDATMDTTMDATMDATMETKIDPGTTYTNTNAFTSRFTSVQKKPPEKNEKEMEKLWAKEQYDMAQTDREAASYELHGVQSRYNAFEYENPERLYQALLEFDEVLNNPKSSIPHHLKKGYDRALCLNSTYVLSSEFRVRFLRAEFFEIKKAVIRFCKCLNLLVTYFGEISLLRQIFLSDLSRREIKLLKEGSMQLSPCRDTLGRRVIFFVGNCGAQYDPEERNKVGLYLILQVLAEDVTTQQNGLVSVHLLSEDVYGVLAGENTSTMANLFLSTFEATPIRFSAVHMCFSDGFTYQILKPLMLFLIGEKGRKVLRIHSGMAMERFYSLSSFGVRSEEIPITYSGNVKTRQHMKWLKVRSAMDRHIKDQFKAHGNYRTYFTSKIESFPHIQCPEINCVLFHKNGVAWDFPGNVKFRAFLDKEISNYDDTKYTSYPREDILYHIIRSKHMEQFQFLLYDDANHWYDELTGERQLRKYLGLAYRGHQRRFSAQRHTQTTGTSDAGGGNRNEYFFNMNGKDRYGNDRKRVCFG